MEYSLTVIVTTVVTISAVLILILMEYSLTACLAWILRMNMCLNPYSNGILSDLAVTTVK